MEGLNFKIYIFAVDKHRVRNHKDLNILKDKIRISSYELLMSSFEFTNLSDSKIDFHQTYFVYIVLNLKDRFNKIKKYIDKNCLIELEDGDLERYSIDVSLFPLQYINNSVSASNSFEFIGFGVQDDKFKIYIKDNQNTIYDSYINYVNVFFKKSIYKDIIYSKVIANGQIVRIIIAKPFIISILKQCDCIYIYNETIREKINLFFNLDEQKKYNIKYLANELFVIIFSDEDLSYYHSNCGLSIKPELIFSKKFSSFSEYLKTLEWEGFEKDRIQGEEDDQRSRDEEEYYRRQGYDEWEGYDYDTKLHEDPDRLIDESDTQFWRDYEMQEESNRSRLEFINKNKSEEIKFSKAGIKQEIIILSFSLIEIDYESNRKTESNSEDYLFGDEFLEITCFIPSILNDHCGDRVKKYYLIKVDDKYFGICDSRIFIMTFEDYQFCYSKEIQSHYESFFNVLFKMETGRSLLSDEERTEILNGDKNLDDKKTWMLFTMII